MQKLETEEFQNQILTVDEIRQKADQFVACDHQLVRYAPQEVITTARTHFGKSGDFRKTASYVIAAYEFFRGCVCWGEARIGVPLVLADGAFEWLEPANFDWKDLELIRFYAAKAGTGFANFGLDKSEPFFLPDISRIGFADSMTWQEDSAKLLLRPLRNLQNGKFKSETVASCQLQQILDQLLQVSTDNFISRYLGYQPRFG